MSGNRKRIARSLGITLALLALAWAVHTALAQGSDGDSTLSPAGGSPVGSMTYQGYLQDGGQPANGLYDFRVDIWNAESGGAQQGSTQVYDTSGIAVEDGIFTLYFTPGDASQVFSGGGRWIELEVRPHGVGSYTTLPRQPITNVPYAWGLKPGAIVSGTVDSGDFGGAVLNVNARHPWGGGPYAGALFARSNTSSAVRGESGGKGVYGSSTWTYGVHGTSVEGTAGRFSSEGGHGLWASTTSTYIYHHGGSFSADMGYGVYARSAQNQGVRAEAGDVAGLAAPEYPVGVVGLGDEGGVYGSAETGAGVFGTSTSSYGVHGEADGYATGVYGHNTSIQGGIGVYGDNDGSGPGVSGVSSSGPGTYGYSSSGPALRGVSFSGNLIELYDTPPPAGDRRFYVSNDGDVYADGGYHCGLSSGCWVSGSPADLAEVLPVNSEPEPGDVLIVTANGELAPSSEPYQHSVVGVYSTRPMMIGGAANLDEEGFAPLAVVGIVPVKASAENGPIAPGDLLTSSSMPGHAMRTEEFVGGAIIGKALEGLDEGNGLIQMLVTLQ